MCLYILIISFGISACCRVVTYITPRTVPASLFFAFLSAKRVALVYYILITILLVSMIDTRKMVDLESHWQMKERPVLLHTDNEAAYEAKFAQLLDRFPCPEDYIKTEDIIGRDPVVKEF